MKPTLIAISIFLPLLSGAISTAQAVECAKGVVRAGCAGPQWRRRRRTTGGSGCRNEWGAHAVGGSTWHDRHGRAREHCD